MSKACEIVGQKRQRINEVRMNVHLHGREAAIDQLSGQKGLRPNRIPEEMEKAILNLRPEHPTYETQ